MPTHVPKDMSSSFKQIITASYNGKEAKKGADHRESLVYVCKWLMNTLPDHFSTTIFLSILEIQEIYILLVKMETISLYYTFILEYFFQL